jgi:hypothetical protein
MQLFVVISDRNQLLGIYSTLAQAQQRSDRHVGACIEQYVLDKDILAPGKTVISSQHLTKVANVMTDLPWTDGYLSYPANPNIIDPLLGDFADSFWDSPTVGDYDFFRVKHDGLTATEVWRYCPNEQGDLIWRRDLPKPS